MAECFKVATKFRILYFIMLNKEIRSARLVYTRPWTLKFLAASSTTMATLPLKKLDFGLQKPTGPSSVVVASIVLIIIALSSVSFFFTHNSHTFQIVLGELQDTFTLNHFFKNQNCCCSKNHKKSKLGHKVIIFISLERSCVTLHSELITFLFSILLSSYFFFL